MDSYIGKHLLVDCYNCRNGMNLSVDSLTELLYAAYEQLETEATTVSVHEGPDELTVAAYGDRVHMCLHAYEDMCYIAADIYSFHESFQPEKAMAALRKILRPEKIRATSVKRGNIAVYKDMKPSTRSKSTTMNKVRRTKRQLSTARKKMVGYIKRQKLPSDRK